MAWVWGTRHKALPLFLYCSNHTSKDLACTGGDHCRFLQGGEAKFATAYMLPLGHGALYFYVRISLRKGYIDATVETPDEPDFKAHYTRHRIILGSKRSKASTLP